MLLDKNGAIFFPSGQVVNMCVGIEVQNICLYCFNSNELGHFICHVTFNMSCDFFPWWF